MVTFPHLRFCLPCGTLNDLSMVWLDFSGFKLSLESQLTNPSLPSCQINYMLFNK